MQEMWEYGAVLEEAVLQMSGGERGGGDLRVLGRMSEVRSCAGCSARRRAGPFLLSRPCCSLPNTALLTKLSKRRGLELGATVECLLRKDSNLSISANLCLRSRASFKAGADLLISLVFVLVDGLSGSPWGLGERERETPEPSNLGNSPLSTLTVSLNPLSCGISKPLESSFANGSSQLTLERCPSQSFWSSVP